MKKPGVFLRRWNRPDHFRRTSMSSSARSCHVVLPSLQIMNRTLAAAVKHVKTTRCPEKTSAMLANLQSQL